MVAQLFNNGTTPIYLDEIDASAGLFVSYNPTTDGYLAWGIAMSTAEEQQCATQQIWWEDWGHVLNPLANSSDTAVRVSSQVCTPHGLAYGIPYTGPGNCGGYNYTCITTAPLKRCRSEYCALHYNSAIAIPAGTGISVWTARYRSDGAAFGWTGIASVNFKWHE